MQDYFRRGDRVVVTSISVLHDPYDSSIHTYWAQNILDNQDNDKFIVIEIGAQLVALKDLTRSFFHVSITHTDTNRIELDAIMQVQSHDRIVLLDMSSTAICYNINSISRFVERRRCTRIAFEKCLLFTLHTDMSSCHLPMHIVCIDIIFQYAVIL
jgi:hypothetical protein